MGTLLQGMLRGTIRAAMYLAFRPKVTYQDPNVMKTEKPVVFICNHMSHYDGALIASVLHRKKPYFLIAKDWYDKKQFGVFLKLYGSVPVDRSGMDTGWYEQCRKLLEAGHSILIFPEGRTSKGDMHEFQPGFAVLAEKTGAMVVECVNAGDYHILFGGRKHVLVGNGYELKCPAEMRKSQYAKQIASQARERLCRQKKAWEAKGRWIPDRRRNPSQKQQGETEAAVTKDTETGN